MTKDTISPGAFFKRHLPDGVTITAAARRLGIPHPRLRAWLSRGRVPEKMLKGLADLIGVSVEQLEKAGFRGGGMSPRKPYQLSQDSDLFQLLKNIVASGLETLTLMELDYLLLQQQKFESTMSPVLIKELIFAEFPYRGRTRQ